MSKHKLINKLLIAHIEQLNGKIKSDKEWAERQHTQIQNLERELRQAERYARSSYVAPATHEPVTFEELEFLMNPREVSAKKITAIKIARCATGSGLKDAKDFIEGINIKHARRMVDAPKAETVPNSINLATDGDY